MILIVSVFLAFLPQPVLAKGEVLCPELFRALMIRAVDYGRLALGQATSDPDKNAYTLFENVYRRQHIEATQMDLAKL